MTNDEIGFMDSAVELAKVSESEGNLPIGAVLVLDRKVISTGRNRVWYPINDQTRHAEMDTLRAVPENFRGKFSDMKIYTTLEPCMMCFTSLAMHGIGGITFGASGDWMGASLSFGSLPPRLEDLRKKLVWKGPVDSIRCDQLFRDAVEMVKERSCHCSV
jgi:tRNA(adenine34) deaminase